MESRRLKVLDISDRKLRKVCREVSLRELRTKKLQDLIEQMLDFTYGRNNKGVKRKRNKPMTVGLSANQVGILKRISIVDFAIGRMDFSDIRVLINPRIVWHSKASNINREGCVNLPELGGIVSRYKEVKVETLDRSGNKFLIHAKGWLSILLQHEIDHLNGFLFIDRLPDPQKAHCVRNDDLSKYRKNFRNWKKFTDVSKWVV